MTSARAVIATIAGLLLPAATLLSPPLLSAPAPRPRPPRPLTRADLAGVWLTTWGQTRATIHLARDGSYQCDWCGSLWVGSWSCTDTHLLISERPATDTEPRESAVLRWERQADGSYLCEGVTLRLIERVRRD